VTFLTALVCRDALCLLQLSKTGADAASQLSRLWKQSAQAKLLQRPPADRISAKYEALFKQSYHETVDLGVCTDEVLRLQSEDSLQLAQEFLQAILAAKPVSTLALLPVWLQQRPELLQLPQEEAQQPINIDDSRYCTLWMCCSRGARNATAAGA
jgi:hypothetical protein